MSDLNKWLMTEIKDIPEADVSEFEKKQLKKHLLSNKRKAPRLSKIALAAGILAGASGIAAIAFPSLASQIPILQDIVTYFEEDELIFSHFSEVAQPLGLTQTSNGSTVEIEEAVYDGTSVTISFALKTETDLGEVPFSTGFLEASGAGGSGSAVSMNKIDDTTYAGMITMAPDFFFGSPNTLKLSWKPESFEDAEGDKILQGDWSFEFKLKALDSKSVKINEPIRFKGGEYALNEISLTKLSTVLTLDAKGIDEDHYLTEWLLEDDLGNIYPMQFGTGSDSSFQFTFEALDPAASAVSVKPIVNYLETPEAASVRIEVAPVSIELK